MKNTKEFQNILIMTWVDEKPEKIFLKLIDFYEKETGHKIDKMFFEQNPNPENFLDIMNQIGTHNQLGEEIKRIKSLLK